MTPTAQARRIPSRRSRAADNRTVPPRAAPTVLTHARRR